MFIGNLGCRHCRYYQQQGRRGGHCQKLDVAVQGFWPACSLVILPFAGLQKRESEGRQESLPLLPKESFVQAIPPP